MFRFLIIHHDAPRYPSAHYSLHLPCKVASDLDTGTQLTLSLLQVGSLTSSGHGSGSQRRCALASCKSYCTNLSIKPKFDVHASSTKSFLSIQRQLPVKRATKRYGSKQQPDGRGQLRRRQRPWSVTHSCVIWPVSLTYPRPYSPSAATDSCRPTHATRERARSCCE